MSIHLTQNAKVVLEKRYLLRDADGLIAEDPEGLFRRVARFIAEGELQYGKSATDVHVLAETFYQRMADLEFLPNSPTLMNAGKPNGQLSACFVLPVADSLEGIFDTLKHAALIHQSGGGTGFSFSRLRPKGDVLRYTSGVTSGPLSFMDVYNAATEAIKQGGTRRGANMGILRIDHPDIEAFIGAKNDLTRLTNFNISVAVTDVFMEAVLAGKNFDLIHPNTQTVAKTLPARDLMNQIVENAWRTGEPGMILIDRINADNVTPALGQIESTNPCGEVPLLPYEACNLGSINMVKMLRQGADNHFEVDWDHFLGTIRDGVHFLENVIVQNTFPIPQVQQMVEGNRKIGLGLMGWADALLKMGIPYHSAEAMNLARDVMAFMAYHSKRRSIELAQERGSFPFFDQSVYPAGNWFTRKYQSVPTTSTVSPADWANLDQQIQAEGLRHATTICLAPTGTISIIAGVSGGIEPLFALAFIRNVMDNTELTETNPIFKDTLVQAGLYSEELLHQVGRVGSIQHLSAIPQTLRDIFVTAQDISPEGHIRMQAAFQTYSDNAVSKTINFPESASMRDIEQTYELAYKLGLKGVTVYRNNSRKLQPMSIAQIPGKAVFVIDSQHCPECQKPLQVMEGCLQCPDCQYAYCG